LPTETNTTSRAATIRDSIIGYGVTDISQYQRAVSKFDPIRIVAELWQRFGVLVAALGYEYQPLRECR
jgi:hypothetical protein